MYLIDGSRLLKNELSSYYRADANHKHAKMVNILALKSIFEEIFEKLQNEHNQQKLSGLDKSVAYPGGHRFVVKLFL
jgi:hypothetical protein